MSLLDKLKNTINYKISQVLDTPEVTAYAAEQAQEKAEQDAETKIVQDKVAAKKAEEDRIKALEASKPPTAAQAAWNSFKKVWVYGLAAFFSTILGSMCANAAIHRNPLIRLLMFIYGSVAGTLLLIVSLSVWIIPIIALFVLIFLYNIDGLPHFYAYLPLSTYQSPNNFVRYLLALFTYDPKSERNKDHIINKKAEYKGILEAAVAVAAAATNSSKQEDETS